MPASDPPQKTSARPSRAAKRKAPVDERSASGESGHDSDDGDFNDDDDDDEPVQKSTHKKLKTGNLAPAAQKQPQPATVAPVQAAAAAPPIHAAGPSTAAAAAPSAVPYNWTLNRVLKAPKVKRVPKVYKPLARKWEDLPKWKAGDDPVGALPSEVLDLIISVDSDLDLRDHIALAGTCRYFRTCYTDVIFQILIKKAHGSVRGSSPDSFHFTEDGHIYPDYSGSSSAYGPHERGWNIARHIFSGGGESAHPLWAGWGLSSEDHKAKRAEMATAMAERRALIDTEWQLKAEARRAEILADQKKQDIERKERLEKATVAYQAQSAKVTLIRQTIQDPVVLAQTLLTENATLQHLNGVYRIASAPISANLWLVQAVLSQWWEELLGLDLVRPNVSRNKFWNDQPNSHRVEPSAIPTIDAPTDPWHSPWRHKAAELVNQVFIVKTNAKSVYKCSDRELAALTSRKIPGRPGQFYVLSAVQALALRARGGVAGLEEHKAKLAERAKKIKETKIKNGTLKVAQPKPARRGIDILSLFSSYMGGYDDYDDYDDYGDYDDYDEDEGYDGLGHDIWTGWD